MNAARMMTANDLVRALRRRRAALPSEIGSFIIFEACEALLSGKPGRLALETISISEEGVIAVEPTAGASEEAAARSLHGLLTSLLVAAGPAPTNALLRLVEEGPREGRWTLDQMRDDLEEALVPLNRTASRRVLSRLVRETTVWSDNASGRGEKVPTFNELDEQLSSFLGVPHVPSNSPPEVEVMSAKSTDATRREPVHSVDSDSDELHVMDDEPTGRQERKPESRNEGRSEAPGFNDARFRDLHGLSERPSQMPRSTSGAWLGAGLVLLTAGLIGVTLLLRPDALARLRGDAPAAQPVRPAQPVLPAARGGDLIINVAAERAQILRFVGLGPLTIEHLPTGVAHELVAIADNAAPTRVLIPKDAEWEKTPDGLHYEVAMQARATRAQGASLDLGDTLLPAEVGRPTHTLGSVRVVTTPRGAKVYQVIGFAPEAVLHDVALDRSEELLIWKRGFKPETRVMTANDFLEDQGRRVARIAVTLKPDKR
jgi:hypothetical protein